MYKRKTHWIFHALAAPLMGLLSLLLSTDPVRAQQSGWPGIFYPYQVRTINLSITPSDWQALENDNTFTVSKNASMWADGENAIAVTVRRKISNGLTQGGINKISLKIDINGQVPGQSWHQLQKVSLESGAEFGVVKEGVAWRLHAMASSMPHYQYQAGHAAWVRLVVNGSYLGLYLNNEQRDDEFLKNRKLYKDGATWLYKPIEWVVGSPPSPTSDHLCYSPFSLSTPACAAPQNLGEDLPDWIDADNLLTLGAVESYMFYTDGMFTRGGANCYRLDYSRPKLLPSLYFPWDLDLCDFTPYNANIYSADWWDPVGGSRPSGYQQALLLNNPYYRQRYQEIMRDMLNGPLSATAVIAVLNALEPVLTPHLAEDPNTRIWEPSQFNSRYSLIAAHFTSLRSWANARVANIWTQLPNFLEVPVASLSGAQLSLTHENSSGTIYYTLDGTDPWSPGGYIASSALTYSGPIGLSTSKYLRSRVKNGVTWSPISQMVVNIPGYADHLRNNLKLTEIQYHPAGPSAGESAIHSGWDKDDFEFVELKNTGTTTLDLSGCYIAGQAADQIEFKFAAGTTLAPQSFYVIVRNPAAFEARYPGVHYDQVFFGKLDNGGQAITLYNSAAESIILASYDDNSPWPTSPDGTGYTLVNANPAGNPASASTWRASFRIHGSPGADDEASVAAFVRTDVLTRGDWIGRYGSQGYVVSGDEASYPANAQIGISSTGSFYLWPDDPPVGGLLRPSNPSQTIQACYHSPDNVIGGNFTIDVRLNDAQTHQLALYFLDYDSIWPYSSRQQTVEILDAFSGSVLDTRTVTEFQSGKYLAWNVRGHVRVRLTYLGGPWNAVMSGLFLDSPSQTRVWVDDAGNLPVGAQLYADGESWNWNTSLALPFFGSQAHQSAWVNGFHQHYFDQATATLQPQADDVLYCYVYVDPSHLPSTVMLQWLATDGSWWHHRAYWGQNNFSYWGPSIQMSSTVPPANSQWIRLEVPAWRAGLVGRTVSGMAFTLYNGRVAWDKAGIERGPASSDTDLDGLPDAWEQLYFGTLNFGPYHDNDGDWLSNSLELRWNSNPSNPETDGDGLIDGDEFYFEGTDPSLADTDGDGLSDPDEVYFYQTDPWDIDTDNDNWSDGWEVIYYNTDPLNPASHP